MSEAKQVNPTLCWRCHNALNIDRNCCWADHLEPRPDWIAIPTNMVSGGPSFMVMGCPGFISDKEWAEKEAEKCECI